MKKLRKLLIKNRIFINKLKKLSILVLYLIYLLLSPKLPTTDIQDIGIIVGLLISVIIYKNNKQ